MSRIHSITLMVTLLLSIQTVQAQQRPVCGTTEYQAAQEKQDPALRQRRAKIENQTEAWIKAGQTSGRRKAVITIPVVVHVVYRTTAENISNAQIQSQIEVLNEDFARLNADAGNTPAAFAGVAADTEIRFCLAQRDPDGNPSSGITRTSTNISQFFDNDAVKFTSSGGKNAWDRNRYLNIWVCNTGPALLGYAQFPGGYHTTDGVVIGYNFFGRTGTVAAPYNKGRTATHEVGHWLNLYHIWGDDNGACTGSDLVADTPNQGNANYGCPSFPKISCSNGPSGDMFMNYMDYTDDACMNLFTNGQKDRMLATLNTTRASLKNSNGCVPVVLQSLDATILRIVSPSGFSCSNTFTPVVVLKNQGTLALTSVTIIYRTGNGAPQTYNWTGNLASLAMATVTLSPQTVTPGIHTFTAATFAPNNGTDQDPTNDAATVPFTSSQGQSLPFAESFEGGVFPPANWDIINPDNQLTWALSQVAAKTGIASAHVSNYDYNNIGQADDLVLPPLDLSGISNPGLTFELAYARFSSSDSDTLQVLVSADCGQTFTSVYKKAGNDLATVSPSVRTTSFVPQPSEWRKESISLATYAGNNILFIKFRNITAYENNLFIDDINVGSDIVGIAKERLPEAAWQVYPNPASGLVQIALPGHNAASLKLEIRDVLGKLVLTKTAASLEQGLWQTDISGLAPGVYFFRLQSNFATGYRKVLVTN